MEIMILLVVVVALTLVFDFINGFHDSANAIATVVSTRVMRPTHAVLYGAVLNFIGALLGTEVAAIAVVKGAFYDKKKKATVPTAKLLHAVGYDHPSPPVPSYITKWVESEEDLRTQMKAANPD